MVVVVTVLLLLAIIVMMNHQALGNIPLGELDVYSFSSHFDHSILGELIHLVDTVHDTSPLYATTVALNKVQTCFSHRCQLSVYVGNWKQFELQAV